MLLGKGERIWRACFAETGMPLFIIHLFYDPLLGIVTSRLSCGRALFNDNYGLFPEQAAICLTLLKPPTETALRPPSRTVGRCSISSALHSTNTRPQSAHPTRSVPPVNDCQWSSAAASAPLTDPAPRERLSSPSPQPKRFVARIFARNLGFSPPDPPAAVVAEY